MLVYCIRLTWRTWNCKVNITRYYDRISDPRRSLKEWYQSSGYNPQNSFQCRHSVHSVLNTGLVRSRSEDRSSEVWVSWIKLDSNLFMFRQRKACDGSQCNWSDRLVREDEHLEYILHLRSKIARRGERWRIPPGQGTADLPRWSSYVISLQQGRPLTLEAIRGWLSCTESQQSSRSSGHPGWLPTINILLGSYTPPNMPYLQVESSFLYILWDCNYIEL